MKTLICLVVAAFSLASCTEYIAETRYDARDRITGKFEVDEFNTTYREHIYYDMFVSKDRSSRSIIYLDDFYIESLRVYAHVDDDHINIPFQIVDGYEIEGSGYQSRGKLYLNYSVRDRYSNGHREDFDTIAYPY
jgi:hypothetical protein